MTRKSIALAGLLLASSLLASGCVANMNNGVPQVESQEEKVQQEEANEAERLEEYRLSGINYLTEFSERFDVNFNEKRVNYEYDDYLDSIIVGNQKEPFIANAHKLTMGELKEKVDSLSEPLKKEVSQAAWEQSVAVHKYFDETKLSENDKILIYIAQTNNYFFYDFFLNEKLGGQENESLLETHELFDNATLEFENSRKVSVNMDSQKNFNDFTSKEDFMENYFSHLELVHNEDMNTWFVETDSFIELSLSDQKPRIVQDSPGYNSYQEFSSL